MLSQNSNDLQSSDLQNNAMALNRILERFRANQQSEREKGTYFEELSITFFKNDPTYRQLYSDVWTYADWTAQRGEDKRDIGIDLVAKTHGTEEYHAIQCKFYAPNYRVQKSDIDSFFTASGKKPFTHRVIVTATNLWGEHAENALSNQQPPVTKIDLAALEKSAIVWADYDNHRSPNDGITLKEKKSLRTHQKTALERVEAGLETADRGKLIMACGTGKTFTSLKIAEKLAGKGKRVLFLVPSLSLLSQSLVEWSQESTTPLRSFAVCSDTQVGKSREKSEDYVATYAHELQYPATTDPKRLAAAMKTSHDNEHMSVVFSTYHSIDTISRAQKEHELAEFDLIVCDEAHRTTGQTFDGDDESNFVKVHDADFIQAKKRLYMTATPRIYGDNAKTKANDESITLCSMDDENLYGKELHVIPFSEAVRLGLLVDYKVIVLSVDGKHISARLQNLLDDKNNSLIVDDAAKIVGCWKALSKQDTHEDLNGDTAPMRRAVAFCQVIEANYKGKAHKVSSKNIAQMFSAVVEAYKASELESGEFEEDGLPPSLRLSCEAAHVDGSMNATGKEEKLTWLKAETAEDTCRILSNVRCLSEGVDVPALDAVLFLTPRNSEVDVVQSVGRVMRNAPNKKRGYIILPVVIPAGVEPNKALDDNKTYKVVWQVLQALRSHDDRFDAMINKIDLTGTDKSKMEVIAVTDKINSKTKATKKGDGTPVTNKKAGRGGSSIGTAEQPVPETGELAFNVGEIEKAIIAKVVKKCGNRFHWEDWANDIAKIAQTHIIRIQTILENAANVEAITAFQAFAHEIRDDLNDSVTDAEIVEMLAQHLITKPVFEALFEGHSFAQQNPMSLAMQSVLAVLEKYHLEKEADTLASFYASVKMRAQGIDSAAGKQKIVVELYDKFFRNAFPRMTEKLGIVYTPVEVVDFIIHSVNDILQAEFGQTLGSEGVHIVDPFTGTGTFMTRLLQSGLIAPDRLAAKYASEIHANELVLLAYYIAAINIESVYHDLMAEAKMPVAYTPFSGICLTDTFQLYEKEDLVSQLLVANSGRRKRQKKLDIRVIIGNPPYSSGQTSANDNNANVAYPFLDGRIRDTYAAKSKATNKNALYDSYIRAIRWASDRIKDAGVIGFVTNAGWVDANTADGLRKSLAAEFSSVYVFHLRGSIRGKSGTLAKKEGGNVFDIMAGVCISFLVKNPKATEQGQIHFYDIGDYLSQADKLAKITDLHSMAGITAANLWTRITPDTHGDWINQRDDSFGDHISLGDKKDKNSVTVFENYSRGAETGRDAWCYNSSKNKLNHNIRKMIAFYNKQVELFGSKKMNVSNLKFDEIVNNDPQKISWTSSLKSDAEKLIEHQFNEKQSITSLYRPYSKQWSYFSNELTHRVGQMPRIFPNAAASNRVIIVKQRWYKLGQFALMTNTISDLQPDGGSQCFPLALYEGVANSRAEPSRAEPSRAEPSRAEPSRAVLYPLAA